MLDFTEKQKEIITALKQNELKRINILYGSVRSGKTWISLLIFSLWVLEQPREKTFLMAAKTLTSLKRNCLDLLQDLIGEGNFKYSIISKTGTLFGRKIYLEGANDSRSESKIRGMTLQGAYVDEITLVEEDFFNMLLSRLSEKGAKLFGSTNPDTPNHWLKINFIDRQNKLDIFVKKFTIDENTFLDEEYIKQIKTEYTGVFYERFILGNFTAAEGMIYPNFKECICDNSPPIDISDYVLSIDYGTMNAFAAILWIKKDNIWYAEDEYYYSGRSERVLKTDYEYGQDLDSFIEFYRPNEINKKIKVIIDPSAASFIALMKKKSWTKVVTADNSVIDGIRNTATAMRLEKIKICRKCKNLILELGGYVWDKNSEVDKPLKVNDHAMDSMRYFVQTMGISKIRRKNQYND